jgi:hypothetical protein
MTKIILEKKAAPTVEVAFTVAPFYLVHMLQRTLPAGFIAPCLPTKTDKLPSGSCGASHLRACCRTLQYERNPL